MSSPIKSSSPRPNKTPKTQNSHQHCPDRPKWGLTWLVLLTTHLHRGSRRNWERRRISNLLLPLPQDWRTPWPNSGRILAKSTPVPDCPELRRICPVCVDPEDLGGTHHPNGRLKDRTGNSSQLTPIRLCGLDASSLGICFIDQS